MRKFTFMCVKKRQEARFLSPRCSKITVTKEKERKKGKSEEKEKRIRKRSNSCTVSFYNNYFEDWFWPKKLLDAKGLFGDNAINYPVR